MEVPPEPKFQRGWLSWNPWARGWLTSLVLASRPGKGLVGAAEAAQARVLPGESTSPFCPLCLWSWRCLGCLVLRLPSPALLSVAAGAALTARAQVKGSKGEPLLLYTDTNSCMGPKHAP